jgi:hypothetical protein
MFIGDFDGDGSADLLEPGTTGGFALYPGDGHGNFGAARAITVSVANSIYSTKDSLVADFDGNGFDDLMVGGLSVGYWMFGPSGATLVSGVVPPFLGLGDPLVRLAAGDLDGDGFIDLVVASRSPGAFPSVTTHGPPHLLRNSGNGTFAPFPGIPSITLSAGRVWIDDITGDGRPDVVFLQEVTGNPLPTPALSLVVLTWSGSGFILGPPGPSVAPGWTDADLGDVDGNGLPDLFVGRGDGPSELYLNMGNGAFVATPGPTVATIGVEVRLVDLDADGDEEVVLIDNGDRVFVYDYGTMGFSPATQVIGPTPEPPTTFAHTLSRAFLGDADGDGDDDMVAPSLGLLLNDGTGSFTESHRSFSPQLRFDTKAVADVDGDGYPDLFSVRGRRLTLSLNDGSGRWSLANAATLPMLPPVTTDSNSFVQPLDFDGDGDTDLVFFNSSPAGSSLVGPDAIIRNDGNLSWSLVLTMPGTGDVRKAIPADLDGDGDTDLVLVRTSTSNPPLEVMINTGAAATRRVISSVPISGAAIHDAVVVDFDLDGDMDIVRCGSPCVLLANDGAGVFTPVPSFPAGLGAGSGVTADLDGNGHPDFVLGRFAVFNLGFGTFAVVPVSNEEYAQVVAATDVDKDGDIDLVFSHGNVLQVFENDGSGGFTLVDLSAWAGTQLAPLSVVDVDRDGDDDLVTRSEVYVNLRHQISRDKLPRAGRPSRKLFFAPPGTLVDVYVSLGRADFALPPFGQVFLDLSSLVFVTTGTVPATGPFPLSFVVPSGPGVAGTEIFWQAVFHDGPYLSGLEATVIAP